MKQAKNMTDVDIVLEIDSLIHNAYEARNALQKFGLQLEVGLIDGTVEQWIRHLEAENARRLYKIGRATVKSEADDEQA